MNAAAGVVDDIASTKKPTANQTSKLLVDGGRILLIIFKKGAQGRNVSNLTASGRCER